MDPHTQLIEEHKILRQKANHCKTLLGQDRSALESELLDFQSHIRIHFQHEDTYYRILDDDKRISDRGLVHQLRNDNHAGGEIFSLESLLIRLRKNGVTPEWKTRFENVMGVFLPHLDQEEKVLFPTGRKLLTREEIDIIAKEIENQD